MNAALNDILHDCASFLLSKREPLDGGWALNFDRKPQPTSIVNTAEALYVLTAPLEASYNLVPSINYLLNNIFMHGLDSKRQDYTRYLSYGILGLHWAGVETKHSQISEAVKKLRRRYKKEQGWSEMPRGEISMHSTFFACKAIASVSGWDRIRKPYSSLINDLYIKAMNGFISSSNKVFEYNILAPISYLALLNAGISESRFESPLLDKIHDLLLHYVKNNRIVDYETIHGTSWAHYATCWAIKALLHYKVANRANYFHIAELALNQLIANWRPGGGFLEPGTKFVNVRSIFNPCIAIKSYLSAVSLQRDNSPRVFIVHGRNLELTDRVELFLRRIGCDCIELRFEPAGSKTIQEKFNDIADSAFDCVVVLMTADDKGSLKKQKRTKNRARQNVVLELGYFLSQLGNEHVFILAHKSVETPSDLHGAQIIYIERNFNNTLAKLGNEIQCIRGIQPRKISAALQA